MALYDDPKKKRPLTALEQQAAATQADYGASVGRMQTAQKQATGIQIPMPIIQEGRGSFKSVPRPGSDAALTALRTLGGVARQEQSKQAAMIPTFNQQAAGLRTQAGADRTTAANLGANKLLAGVGAAPVATPTPVPAVARPDFSNVVGGSRTTYGSTQSSASTPTGAGASTAAGGAAPKPDDPNTYTNGAGVTKRVDSAGTMGSVNQQNFGNPVVPQAPGSIARPGVASTFGLSVTDPRANDQNVESVNIQRPGNLTFNSAGNAETFNARQDREASKALASDLGTEAFMLRGKTDPASLRALAEVAQTRAGLLSGTEGLSAAAIQGTANRDNQFGIADLNNSGENNRSGIQADVARAGQQVAREGQQLSYQSSMADIARPQLKQDANGNFINIAGGSSTNVVDANGRPVRGEQTASATRDFQQEADDKLLGDLLANKVDATGMPTPNALKEAMAELQAIRGQSQIQAPPGMKQIGTSGGKPVYEDAQGKRFIP